MKAIEITATISNCEGDTLADWSEAFDQGDIFSIFCGRPIEKDDENLPINFCLNFAPSGSISGLDKLPPIC